MAMGRPRKFDPDQALEGALTAFRLKGYGGTSMADLMEATGLHKGSLYQTFGDKHDLFIACLEKYQTEVLDMFRSRLSNSPSPAIGIRNASHGMIELGVDSEDAKLGCMAVNCLSEFGDRDGEVLEIMERMKGKIGAELIQAMTKAEALGEVELSRSPELTVMLLMSAMSGVQVQMKSFIDVDTAKQIIDEQLNLLGICFD